MKILTMAHPELWSQHVDEVINWLDATTNKERTMTHRNGAEPSTATDAERVFPRPFATSPMPKKLLWLVSLLLCVLIRTAESKAQQISYKYANVDGVRIFYREAGKADSPTILLLHGFPSSSFMFRDLIPRLSDHFHVIAPDYPGMGYSEAPPADAFEANDDNLARVIGDFVQSIGQHRMILYMQDLGGPVGMRIATNHPDWVAGLIFQNTPISMDAWAPARLKLVQASSGPITQEKQALAEKRVSLDTDILLHQQGARNVSALNPDAWFNDEAAIEAPEKRRIMADYLLDIPASFALYPKWHDYLWEHKPKTLVVWGKGDPVFVPAGAEAIRSAVPTAIVRYYDTGHFALEEDGVDIARQIISVFER